MWNQMFLFIQVLCGQCTVLYSNGGSSHAQVVLMVIKGLNTPNIVQNKFFFIYIPFMKKISIKIPDKVKNYKLSLSKGLNRI